MKLAYFAESFVRNTHVDNLSHTVFPSQKKTATIPPRANTILPIMVAPPPAKPTIVSPPPAGGMITIGGPNVVVPTTKNTGGGAGQKGGGITSWLGAGGLTGTSGGMPSAAQGIKDLAAYIPYLQGVAAGTVSVAPDSATVSGALANIQSAVTDLATNPIPYLVTLAGGVNSAFKAQIRNPWSMVNPNDGGKALASLLANQVDGSGATVDAVNTALNAVTSLQQNLANVNQAVTGHLGNSAAAWQQAYTQATGDMSTMAAGLQTLLSAIATANQASGANSAAAAAAAANVPIAQALLAFAQAHADQQATQIETVMAQATTDAASAFGAIDASDWSVATAAVSKLTSDVNQAGSYQANWDPNWLNVQDLPYGGPGTTFTGTFGDVIFQATDGLSGTITLMQTGVADITAATNDVTNFQSAIATAQPLDKAALAAIAAANAVVTLTQQGVTQVQSGNTSGAQNTLTQALNALAQIQATPFQGFFRGLFRGFGAKVQLPSHVLQLPGAHGSTSKSRFDVSYTGPTGAYQSPGTPTTTTLATNQANATTAIQAAQQAIQTLQSAIANPATVNTTTNTGSPCGPGYQMDPLGSGQCVPIGSTYNSGAGGTYLPPPITPLTTTQAGNSSLSAAGNEVAAADQAALQVLQTSDPTQANNLLNQATQLSAQANTDYSNAQMDPTSDPTQLANVGNALTQLASDLANAQNYVAQMPPPPVAAPLGPVTPTPAPSSGTPWGLIAVAAAGLLGGYAVYRSSK